MRTSTEKLAAALHILANDIQSDDGVANAAILEAAVRLREQDQRIKQLIAERDTARAQADQKVSLREEFESLLGTDKIEEGVAAVTAMKDRIKRLEEAGDKLYWAWMHPFDTAEETLGDNWRKAKEAKP